MVSYQFVSIFICLLFATLSHSIYQKGPCPIPPKTIVFENDRLHFLKYLVPTTSPSTNLLFRDIPNNMDYLIWFGLEDNVKFYRQRDVKVYCHYLVGKKILSEGGDYYDLTFQVFHDVDEQPPKCFLNHYYHVKLWFWEHKRHLFMYSCKNGTNNLSHEEVVMIFRSEQRMNDTVAPPLIELKEFLTFSKHLMEYNNYTALGFKYKTKGCLSFYPCPPSIFMEISIVVVVVMVATIVVYLYVKIK